MTEVMQSPERAHTIVIKAGGDTARDLADELRSLANRIDRDELTRGCGGGPTNSSIYEYRVDAAMTHDAYFQAIEAWLVSRKEPTT